MSTIANPNWLAISAAFVAVSGIGILARAAISGVGEHASEDARISAANRRSVNTYIGAPLTALGFIMHAMSQMTAPTFSVFFTVVMLTLAFGLLLYGCLEHSLADRFTIAKEAVKPQPRLQLIAPPAAEAREPSVMARPVEATALP